MKQSHQQKYENIKIYAYIFLIIEVKYMHALQGLLGTKGSVGLSTFGIVGLGNSRNVGL